MFNFKICFLPFINYVSNFSSFILKKTFNGKMYIGTYKLNKDDWDVFKLKENQRKIIEFILTMFLYE